MEYQSWRKTLRAILFLTGASVLAGCLDKPYNVSALSLLSSYTSTRDNVPVLFNNVDLGKIVENSTFDAPIEAKFTGTLDVDKERVNETEEIQSAVPQTVFISSQTAIKRVDVEKRLSPVRSEASPGLNESLTSMAVGGLPLKNLPEIKHAPTLVEPCVSHAWLLPLSSEKRSKHLIQGESQMANIFSVSNSEDFMNALASAKGGDTLELAPGHYGDLALRGSVTNVRFDSAVTIVSADPDNQAVISGLDLRDASNLKFDDLIFDYDFNQGDPGWVQPFAVRDSDNITFSNSSFIGDVARDVSEVFDGYGTGYSLRVVNSEDIAILENSFETAGKGLILNNISGLNVVGNEISDMREDGMNLIEVENAVIEDNYIHDFRTHPEDPGHRDMIQLWVVPSHDAPGKNIKISGNTLDIGDGVFTQGIFMRNGAAELNPEDTSMYWQNITIENNVIYNNHAHGITVGETLNLSITNNTLIQVDDVWGAEGANMPPRINVAENSENVVVSENITSDITGYSSQDSWNVISNALVSKEEYTDNFVTSSMTPNGGVHSFYLLPDGKADALGAGSSHILFPDAPDSLKPLFQVHSDMSSSQTLIFDASLTVGPLGIVSENDAEFLWSFEDGSTATGRVVKHEFEGPGHHDVTLMVTDKDGATAQGKFSAGIAGRDILQFDAQTGKLEALAFGEETPLDSIQGSILKAVDGYALKLGGEGTQARVSKSELSPFFGTNAFEVSMSVKADNNESWGEIAYLPQSFRTFVDQSGNFVTTLFLDDGSRINVASEGVSMNDGNVYDVMFRFDNLTGLAEILIDDQVVASESVSGTLDGSVRDLMFGNPWGNQKFDGELSAFTLSADSNDFPIYGGQALPSSSEIDTLKEPSTFPDTTETEETSNPENDPETNFEPKEQEAVPETEKESSVVEPLLNGGYQIDIASQDSMTLHDDAYIIQASDDQLALSFDGKKDFVSLGRLTEFESSQKIGFSVDFVNKNGSEAREILVWNHLKVGLSLENDGLRVHANSSDSHFSKGFQIEGLGLNDGERHNATVMIDAEADRLQVVVNDEIVFDERNTDFDFVGAGGHEWGWSLSSPWSRSFEGEVHDFQVSDDFEFLDGMTVDDIPLG